MTILPQLQAKVECDLLCLFRLAEATHHAGLDQTHLECRCNTLLRNSSLRTLLSVQAPPLLVSFVIASLYFRGWGFARECLAFLALWLVLDAGYTYVRSILWKNSDTTSIPTK